MTEFAKEILPVNLEDEMQQSYLDYAMSVIVGRALPDVRDGLKPVHRRVLFAMSELGNDWNKPYKKSARVVGDVIGKYHPHGDTAVYDTIVRMAQPFSLRYMLVDGQGNFGSVDGDAPAAMRYTEVRMAKIAHELLADIDKETVDFVPNYDESEQEPAVLPAGIPNLLVNGSSRHRGGHGDQHPAAQSHRGHRRLPGADRQPDAHRRGADGDHPRAGLSRPRRSSTVRTASSRPTGPVVAGSTCARAPRSKRRRISGRQRIVVNELPYQVNKARLLEKIAELVKEKKLEGITELRDESDKDGMRMVIELRRGEVAEVVLNNLFQQTQMQSVFGINMVALVDGQPRTLNLKQMLEYFLRHRREVVTRRTLFELRKARDRAHILEGLAVALANIDEIIALIKAAPSPAEAKQQLVERAWQSGTVEAMLARAGADATRPEDLAAQFGLTDPGLPSHRDPGPGDSGSAPAEAHRPGAGQDSEGIRRKFWRTLRDLLDILSSPDRLLQVIRDELVEINEQFGDERRTEIVIDRMDLTLEDLITEEDVVVTLSHQGYAKAQPLDEYRAQRRGGHGKMATATKEEDFVDKLFVANTHDTVLCFSSRGKCYWMKVYEFPQAGRNARGRPMVNLLPLEEGERINAVLPVREYPEDRFVFMATAHGHGQEDAAGRFLAAANQRHHRRGSARRRSSDRRRHHRRRAGRHAVHLGRQGDPLQGIPGARHGPHRQRRARHAGSARDQRVIALIIGATARS